MRAMTACLLALALGGCAEPALTGVGPSESGPAPSAVVRAGLGSIDGLVIDEEQVPVDGARVGLAGPGGATSTTDTDESGVFTFNSLEPGEYNLFAERLGYESAAKRVVVASDEVVKATFELVSVLVATPRQQGFTTNAFIHLAVATYNTFARPNATSEDYRDIYIRVAPDLVSAVSGMVWQSSPAVNTRLMRLDMWVSDQSCRGGICISLNRSQGFSPLIVRSDDFQEHVEDRKAIQINPAINAIACGSMSTDVCASNPDTVVQVAFQQRFVIYTSAFFSQRAPADHNPVPK